MRWKRKGFPPDGTKRIITKFCWIPKYMKDTWVWLENITLEQISHNVNWVDGIAYTDWTTIREIKPNDNKR